MTKSQFIISAPTSNAGKTTLTLGLLRALKARGLNVQPFKTGPDYIDPKFHTQASGTESVNLDLFMMPETHLHQTYQKYGTDAEVLVVEGVMGLFDGAPKAERSTASLAKSLNLPVILVVDAQSVAYSVAPLLHGFSSFDKEINIAGVIFNRVGSKNHYQMLVEACEDLGLKSLGYLSRIPEIEIPSRHLGLSIAQIEKYEQTINRLAQELTETVDLDMLLEVTEKSFTETQREKISNVSNVKIAIAKDEAFNFTYLENLEALKNRGEITFFSPLSDTSLPDCDLLYLPGGYPEMYAEQLSDNIEMRTQIKSFSNTGGKVLAECGGLMYLGKSLTDLDGKTYDMVNVFDFDTSLANKKLSLGYRTVKIGNYEFKGHEFHYSTISNESDELKGIEISTARNTKSKTKIYKKNNTIASYMHWYWGTEENLKDFLLMMNE